MRVNLKSFGVLLEVEVHDESLQPAVERILPPGWEPSEKFAEDGRFILAGQRDGQYSVLVDGRSVGSAMDADAAVHVLDAEMRLRIAASARDYLFAHAGVVAVEGRALLLPGRTFRGKTTLVAALVAAGATYYSDEYAVLDETGAVHPYARHLSMRSSKGGRGTLQSVEGFGGVAGTVPVRPAVIAITMYVPGACWQPEVRNASRGALELLSNAFLANERPEASVRAVTRAAANALVLEGDRGEAAETAASLIQALARAGAQSA
ncbi:MAG: hypothetical protein ABSG64_12720 [Solirubrobacteraceae bacterium]